MYPILFRTQWFFVYSYTAAFAVGIFISLLGLAWREGRGALARWQDGLLAAGVGAILLGRVTFVLTQLDYFRERPEELWQPWQGGITYHGALLGGLVGLWLWSRVGQRPLLPLLDALAPALALLVSFGWVACWLEGCAYGAETFIGPFSADLPDSFGVFAVRYRTQLFGVLLGLVVFGLAVWFQERIRDARSFLTTLLLLSLAQGALTLLRGDAVLMLGSVRIDTALNLLFALIALVLLQYGTKIEIE